MQVLIADDFAAFRSFVRLKLHENGFKTVAEAADGLEAVVKAAELQPALVLLDIGMPQLNGIEAATRIQAVAPKAKILFVSEHTDPDVVDLALSGAGGYVHKSEVNQELLLAIDAVLEGRTFVTRGLRSSRTFNPF